MTRQVDAITAHELKCRALRYKNQNVPCTKFMGDVIEMTLRELGLWKEGQNETINETEETHQGSESDYLGRRV